MSSVSTTYVFKFSNIPISLEPQRACRVSKEQNGRESLEKITRSANAQTTHIQVQNYKTCASYVSQIHTSHTKHTVLDLFNVCSNRAPLNLGRHDYENNLKFIILT